MPRVLVVEDSRTQAEQIRITLESERFEVEVAPDGERGYARFAASDFDLVLTGVLMPGLTGYELCRRIKAHPAKGKTPVILLTTFSDPADILQGLECGADNYVIKRDQGQDLVGRVRHTLAHRAPLPHANLKAGVEVTLLGRRFTITSDREQILDLLLTACEDVVRANRELRASREELERRVRERTGELAQAVEGLRKEVAQRGQAERKYRDIFESALDGIFQTTPEGRYLSANPALARMYGYGSPEDLVREVNDIGREVYVDADRRAEFVRQVEAQGRVTAFESQVRRRDGRVLWISENARAVRDDLGRLLYYEGFQRDITDRKALEEQVRQSQKMDAVGQLAGGVAHDFNNILTVIKGYSDLLLARIPPDAPERAMVEEVGHSAARAAALTRQLLAFSRKQVIQPRVLDLNTVVAEAAKMLSRLIGEDVALSTVQDPELGRVRADPGHVEQVLMNLAVNARDAMPGGGRLTIETANFDLEETYAEGRFEVRPGLYVLLAVSDTGVGMADEVMRHLFEPFFTTKGPGRGTGLGLATVYGIVKQSGGDIGVYSEPGRGTTFKIYLPRVEAAVQESQAALSAPTAAGGTETVLLAEDEGGVRVLVRTVLQMHGYTVLEARDGAEALRVAEGHTGPIHLLISDVVMPEISGRVLAERLAALRPGLRVLYTSGYTDDAVVRHGVLEAEAAFLQKPFRPEALARRVREVLDRA